VSAEHGKRIAARAGRDCGKHVIVSAVDGPGHRATMLGVS
jgi:hypothetical protein